ncbi:MAG: M23 family metallopeptidase, partial [Rikenellaceae bacterium]|nr:M23 family metallopeptidase [Rikenellaceae bacterium]
YDQKLDQQSRQLKNAQDQVQRIIAEEARRMQTTPRTEAEEEVIIALTGRFDQNKGRMPYPVSGGVVIDKFGRHKDPNNPNVEKNQPGITLATERGANVRAVFEGEVYRIFLQPGLGNVVIIQHGNYFTNYTNLETVAVKTGDKVATNQLIGKVYSGDNAENYILNFSISDAANYPPVFVNPEQWLRR